MTIELGEVALDAYLLPATLPAWVFLARAAEAALAAGVRELSAAAGAVLVDVLVGRTGVGSTGAGVDWVDNLLAAGVGTTGAVVVVVGAGGVDATVGGATAGVAVGAVVCGVVVSVAL